MVHGFSFLLDGDGAVVAASLGDGQFVLSLTNSQLTIARRSAYK